MALIPNLQLAEFALNELEALESRCLVWGLVDNALSTPEVHEALQNILDLEQSQILISDPDCSIYTSRDLRDFLVEKKLLFEVPFSNTDERYWRTRMGEGVRLIAKLRQLFSKHGTNRWGEAATLVADYRFLRRSRRYPRRDLSGKVVFNQLEQSLSSQILLNAVCAWLDQLPRTGGLSRFQVTATERILRSLENRNCSGTLVAAGTGSGKTLSFYLPALTWLAAQRVQSPSSKGVRVLALYPRNELLKDQLAEVYDQCRKLDSWITRHGGRPIRVGVLYGDTPNSVKSALSSRAWPNHSDGKKVPFFNCPLDGQHGEMILRRDLSEGNARLVCQSCAAFVDSRTLAFTRDDIKKDPPDILFTSVEMLNRHLSNSDMKHVFGIGQNAERAPDLMLLDEVHLYSGSYGAQVAYLLRRWWYSSGRKTSFVGLSATISDGKSFFSQLTGLHESVVEEIHPLEDDIEEEGAEYLIALRGDPVSQAALLSTTIQALMLGTRMLDTPENFNKYSMPFFGWKAFAFTDQLDATNRLFNDFSDAEGRFSSAGGHANLKKHPNGGLAHLRNGVNPTFRSERYFAGQDWSIPREIGHALTDRLKIGRTTSLDQGVNRDASVIIATASLEVGFDDPAVGLVIQHKAPRDIASFLQRKGRGGRTRHMRPWTMVVLTDYGRDRLAYQAYDQLFDPELVTRKLPLSNRYVQRMQAVYAFLDELGEWTFKDQPPISIWRDLSQPNFDSTPPNWTKEKFDLVKRLAGNIDLPLSLTKWIQLKSAARDLGPKGFTSEVQYAGVNWLTKRLQHQRVVQLLSETLQNSQKIEKLARGIGARLSLSPEEVSVLFWSHPRPLVLGAIPTLMRRIASGWRSNGTAAQDFQAGHPLPDFIPASLFADLSLPEICIDLSEHRLDVEDQFMPVQQALGEFAPGKVSRRFDDALWLGVDGGTLANYFANAPHDVVEAIEIKKWFHLERKHDFYAKVGDAVIKFRAFRPQTAFLQPVPRFGNGVPELSDTSNAQLTWISFLSSNHTGQIFYPSEHIGISKLIKSISLHTHAQQTQAEVRRYAIGSKSELRLRSGQKSERINVDFQFHDSGEPSGVGFEIDVDALVLNVELPEELFEFLLSGDAKCTRAARSARYNWEARQNQSFVLALPNPFLRGWVAQLYQIAVLQVMAAEKLSLTEALNLVSDKKRMDILLNVLQTVFQVPENDYGEEGSDRLRQKLVETLESETVLKAVREVARVLDDPIDSTWNDWVSLTVRATLGAACLEAIQISCPEVDPDSLIVDIDINNDDGSNNKTSEIWISEVNPGGNGLIESVAELLANRPDSLFRHIEAALGPRDFEWTNSQLRQVVQWLGGENTDALVQQSVLQVRQSKNSTDTSKNFADLRSLLVTKGQSIFHGYIVSLSMRLLRPDTPSELDSLIAEIHKYWDDLEIQNGVEIDVRVLCALFSADDRMDHAFTAIGQVLPSENRTAWRFGVLMGMLWPQGHALRSVALPWSNRFSSYSIGTERMLLDQWLTPRPDPIDPNDKEWEVLIRDRLMSETRAIIAISTEQIPKLMPVVIASMATEPVQFEYLNVFAQLSEVKRCDDRIELTFSIPDSL